MTTLLSTDQEDLLSDLSDERISADFTDSRRRPGTLDVEQLGGELRRGFRLSLPQSLCRGSFNGVHFIVSK
jgi:hypothetical protein